MSLNEFAMVEELASLIKDNLPCKHLVLSVEAALVNFLQDDTSLDGVLELDPMDSYKRLLVHRLADIFGFSHESVGEGDARHLVLERCPETSIPSILVSDLLWQYDELHTPKFLEVLEKKKRDAPGLNAEAPKSELSFEDREAAYLAARQRIFSVDERGTEGLTKQRPPNNPTVARRMIAHALGQQIKQCNHDESLRNSKVHGEQVNNIQNDDEKNAMHDKNLNLIGKIKEMRPSDSKSSYSGTKTPKDKIDRSSKFSSPGTERNETNILKDNFKEERMGAAKRMFVNALGFQPRNGNFSRSSQTK
ncbi:hypothetical protein ACH5RR_016172 [Cinchona calisaya]|uniref:R3H domain-containing protein n=1 Tax=Cinchona calisaya TaxID=153742 RepID=A0ABD3A0Q7_9GENT